jgi:hypothetical protein
VDGVEDPVDSVRWTAVVDGDDIEAGGVNDGGDGGGEDGGGEDGGGEDDGCGDVDGLDNGAPSPTRTTCPALGGLPVDVVFPAAEGAAFRTGGAARSIDSGETRSGLGADAVGSAAGAATGSRAGSEADPGSNEPRGRWVCSSIRRSTAAAGRARICRWSIGEGAWSRGCRLGTGATTLMRDRPTGGVDRGTSDDSVEIVGHSVSVDNCGSSLSGATLSWPFVPSLLPVTAVIRWSCG